MKQILIVYRYYSKYGSGLGNVDVTVSFDSPSIKDVREIERKICEAYHYDKVVVLNVIELAEESEDKE